MTRAIVSGHAEAAHRGVRRPDARPGSTRGDDVIVGVNKYPPPGEPRSTVLDVDNNAGARVPDPRLERIRSHGMLGAVEHALKASRS